MTITGLFTGYIFVYHLVYPWKWFVLLFQFVFWQILSYLVILLILIQALPFIDDISVRKLLFRAFRISVRRISVRNRNDSEGVNVILNLNKRAKILSSTLDQLAENRYV